MVGKCVKMCILVNTWGGDVLEFGLRFWRNKSADILNQSIVKNMYLRKYVRRGCQWNLPLSISVCRATSLERLDHLSIYVSIYVTARSHTPAQIQFQPLLLLLLFTIILLFLLLFTLFPPSTPPPPPPHHIPPPPLPFHRPSYHLSRPAHVSVVREVSAGQSQPNFALPHNSFLTILLFFLPEDAFRCPTVGSI